MSNGRITEAALLIANVAEKFSGYDEVEKFHFVDWVHAPNWTVAVNRSQKKTSVVLFDEGATIPFGSMAVFDRNNKLAGVFSANEGYLNNAEEFINDMKELLEKAV